MCTPVVSVTIQCWPDRLSQPEAAPAGAARVDTAPMPSASALNAKQNFVMLAASMLFGDGGRIHRACLIAPARAHVGAKGRDLNVVQADAEFKAAHLRPRACAERRLVRTVQYDVDESRRIRRLQGGVAGERRRRLRCIGIRGTRHTETRRQMTIRASRGVNDF